jgi:DNA-binding transcriptional regulator YhcF (GntR family)
MFIKLEMTKDTPLYEQLKQSIIEAIAKGDLQPGEQLPSVRQLAADLCVNMHTVAKAYNQLKDEGFVTVHRKKGALVNAPDMRRAGEAYYAQLTEQLKAPALAAKCRGIDREAWLELCGKAFDNGAPKKT